MTFHLMAWNEVFHKGNLNQIKSNQRKATDSYEPIKCVGACAVLRRKRHSLSSQGAHNLSW